MRRFPIGKITTGLLILAFATQLAGCGTLLYPERRGQTAGTYDTDIVLLDAAGLLLGVIPGIVAFAVDLTTGAIYLPKGQKSRTREILGAVEIERIPLEGRSVEEIEAALQQHSGIRVDLRAPSFRFTRPAEGQSIETQLEALNRPWGNRQLAGNTAQGR